MTKFTLSDEISRQLLKDFKSGEALPGERELSERYSCNRLTLRRAIKDLNESGLIRSVPRSGHFIAAKIESRPMVSKQSEKSEIPNILLLSDPRRIGDPAHNNLIGGLVHYSSISGANLIIKELPEKIDPKSFGSYHELHPGIEVDAYIIGGGASLGFYHLLAKSLKPCIMIGSFKDQNMEKGYELRCLQLLLSLEQPYAEVGKRLVELGHKKIMLTSINYGHEIEKIKHTIEKQFEEAGRKDYSVEYSYIKGILNSSVKNYVARDSAAKLMKCLSGHTAIIVVGGNVFGYHIFQDLLNEKKLKCPEDISIVVQGSETDYFQQYHELDRIYFERFELGAACIREIMRQLNNKRLEFGIRYLSGAYIPGKSLGPVKNEK